jgi:hypothetical protein
MMKDAWLKFGLGGYMILAMAIPTATWAHDKDWDDDDKNCRHNQRSMMNIQGNHLFQANRATPRYYNVYNQNNNFSGVRFDSQDRQIIQDILRRYPESLGLSRRALERRQFQTVAWNQGWSNINRGTRFQNGLPPGSVQFPSDVKRVLGLPNSQHLFVVLYGDDVFLYDTRDNRVLDILKNVI